MRRGWLAAAGALQLQRQQRLAAAANQAGTAGSVEVVCCLTSVLLVVTCYTCCALICLTSQLKWMFWYIPPLRYSDAIDRRQQLCLHADSLTGAQLHLLCHAVRFYGCVVYDSAVACWC